MSRLDDMIIRLVAQRELLNAAAAMVAGLDGPALELGLGNGRTYSHLREIMPDREIFVFDRELHASSHSMPDSDHLILGQIRETLPFAGPRIGRPPVLVHSDLSNGDPTADLARAHWLTPMLAEMMAPGGLVICGHALIEGQLTRMDPPEGLNPGRYHFYRAAKH